MSPVRQSVRVGGIDGATRYPTQHLTFSEPENVSIDISEQQRIRESADFEPLKSVLCSVGMEEREIRRKSESNFLAHGSNKFGIQGRAPKAAK